MQALAPGRRATPCPRRGDAFACGVDAGRGTPCLCVSLANNPERAA